MTINPCHSPRNWDESKTDNSHPGGSITSIAMGVLLLWTSVLTAAAAGLEAPLESPCLGEFVLAEDGFTCELDANDGFPDEPTAYSHLTCPRGHVCPDGSCVGSVTEFAACSTGKKFHAENIQLSGVWDCGGLVCNVQQTGDKLVVTPTKKGNAWLNGSGSVDESTGKVNK